jgi:hypothetical protein
MSPVLQRLLSALFLTKGAGAPRPTGCVCKGCRRDRGEVKK